MALLEDLLKRLASGRTHSLSELALELDIDAGLLEQMLQDLARAGYIRVLEASCAGQCDHCPYQSPCSLTHGGRIWSVTDKGFRAAEAA